jgi:hypothetical protein
MWPIVRQVKEKGKGRLQPWAPSCYLGHNGKSIDLINVFSFPPASAAEEFFTLQIDHWENRKSSNFHRKSFEGRRRDLRGLIAYSSHPVVMHQLNSQPSDSHYLGHSYCVQIVDPIREQSSASATPRKAILLKNYLGRLRMRQNEMHRAGAYYQIQYPSNCAQRGLKVRSKN